jgi:hypothetical protein
LINSTDHGAVVINVGQGDALPPLPPSLLSLLPRSTIAMFYMVVCIVLFSLFPRSLGTLSAARCVSLLPYPTASLVVLFCLT